MMTVSSDFPISPPLSLSTLSPSQRNRHAANTSDARQHFLRSMSLLSLVLLLALLQQYCRKSEFCERNGATLNDLGYFLKGAGLVVKRAH